MACDEWLLAQVAAVGRPILRTYGWDRPSVTIGYFQAYPREVDSTHAVVRRPTGGALVAHDSDLTFTVVLPPSHPWGKRTPTDRYRRIHERVARIFQQRGLEADLAPAGAGASISRGAGGMRCFAESSRYDVVVHGRKVAGGAQRVTRAGVLHQGSIQGGGMKPVTPRELVGAWEDSGARFSAFRLSSLQEEAVSERAAARFAAQAWNHRVD